MDDYLRGVTELRELAKGAITGVAFGKRRLQRIAAQELIAEAVTLNASKEYLYGVLDAALMLKIISKKEWLEEMRGAE